MANEVTLNFTAEQIDVRLENAGNAILHTEQTLTPEQQEQARVNIGAAAAGAGSGAGAGASLQVVQLSTPLENEVTLTEAEGAALDAAVAAEMPFVLKFDVKDLFTGCVAVASFCAMEDAVMVVLPRFAIFTIGLVKYDGVWACEMTSTIPA